MIERPKTRYELEEERESNIVGGCAIGLFAFLIGFLMGWIANGVGF